MYTSGFEVLVLMKRLPCLHSLGLSYIEVFLYTVRRASRARLKYSRDFYVHVLI